jgi:hypothetical protein
MGEEEDNKPAIIVHYNDTKRAADVPDKLVRE